MYFGLTDVDAGQSYKILNDGNKLSSSNMYAKSAELLQPEDSDLRNMFVSSGNYIYSQYNADGHFNIREKGNDVFVKLNEATQKDGLDVVFGFSGLAWSGVEYYAKQYTVNYISEDGGKITGLTEEKVMPEKNPSGSEATPNKDYKLDYWKADKDVTLEDGTVIKAGEKLTMEQIKQVVVDQDITFIAVYKAVSPVSAPDTGVYTGGFNASVAASLLMGVLLVGGLAVGLTPRVFHKRVGFKK